MFRIIIQSEFNALTDIVAEVPQATVSGRTWLRLGDENGPHRTAIRNWPLYALEPGFLCSRNDIGNGVVSFDRGLGTPIPFGAAGRKVGRFFVDAGQFIGGGHPPTAMPAVPKGSDVFNGLIICQAT